MSGSDSESEDRDCWDGDQYVDSSGERHDMDDPGDEWETGQSLCGDTD